MAFGDDLDGSVDPNPTVKLSSTSAADNRWRTECRTPTGEVRKELGRYTVTVVSRGVLELLEESDYDWRLNESHCVAKVANGQTCRAGQDGDCTSNHCVGTVCCTVASCDDNNDCTTSSPHSGHWPVGGSPRTLRRE